MFSKRVKRINTTPIMKYNNILSYREKEGIKFYKLNIGQPDFNTDKIYYDELAKFNVPINSYCNPGGIEILKNSVCNYYNKKFNQNLNLSNVVITQGASDAIIKILYSICDCKDEILILEPFFADYKLYCNLLGINFKTIKYNDIDYNELNKKISFKTKAILFANPNNPDGSVLSLEDIEKIINVAKKNNLFIISDEVYSGLVYTSNYISLTNYCNNKNIIIVDSASKKLNLCGSRIGYIITKNDNLNNKIIALNDCRISISYAEQYAVSKVLDNSDNIINNSKEIYEKRINKIISKLKSTDIKYIIPKGGISMVLTMPFNNTEEYVKWLITKYENDGKSILIVSCKDFYTKNRGNNKIRLCLSLNNSDLDKALEILIDSCQKYKEEVK